MNPYGTGRMTAQRRAIADVAASIEGAFTIEELLQRLRERDSSSSMATAYRAVAAMESSGFLERVGTRSGSALYAICRDAEHHHHVVCTECGRTAKAPCPIRREPSLAGDFVVTRHEVTLYGLCPNCAEKPEA